MTRACQNNCHLVFTQIANAMSTISKKRKRAAEDDSAEVTLKVKQRPGKIAGPVLGVYDFHALVRWRLIRPSPANFPALQPPANTAFDVYVKKGGKDASSSQDSVLVGETDVMEFVSSEEGQAATAGCK